MDTERSFVMMKPDGVERGLTDEVVRRLEAGGLTIITPIKQVRATSEVATRHYPLDPDYLLTMGHVDISGWSQGQKGERIAKNRRLVEAMHQFIMAGPVVPMIVEGPTGTVAKVREIVGKTNPAEAAPGTIRGEFGEDSYAAADAHLAETGTPRPVRNIVHASGTPAEAEQEIAIWFPEFAR
jgi:nucleoside-diphosphate kinase